MDAKKEIEDFILYLKQTKSVSQEDIATKLGMERTIFSRSKKNNPSDLLKKMKIVFHKEWNASQDIINGKMDAPDELEQAQLIVIVNWLVKLMSEKTGKSVEEIIAEYDADVRLALRNLSK